MAHEYDSYSVYLDVCTQAYVEHGLQLIEVMFKRILNLLANLSFHATFFVPLVSDVVVDGHIYCYILMVSQITDNSCLNYQLNHEFDLFSS